MMTRILKPWDQRFMELCAFWADQCSKDPRTQVGAVLVGKDRRDIALGYNGFPRGIADTDERLNTPEIKHKFVQHAERNVLDNARFDTRGATLYCTYAPCSECCKSIVSKGITRIVCGRPPAREPWLSDASWAGTILAEADVEVTYWKGFER